MNARLRFLLALGVLVLLITGPFLATAGIVLAELHDEAERAAFLATIDRWLPVGGLMTIVALFLGSHLLRLLFKQYVRGLMGMAEHLRVMLGANRDFRVAIEGPPEVQELARAANALAEQRNTLLDDVEARIATASASVAAEKNRLAALMSQLALGVIVCNLDGRILLYNQRARLQFRALAQGAPGLAGGALIGLGRSIFAILERAQIAHVLENIRQRLDKGSAEPVANFITTTRAGQLLRAQMAPVLAAGEGETGKPSISGYVLTIENITKNFEREAQRDQALQSLTDGSRAALGTIRAAVENLISDPAMEAGYRERFVAIIAEEAAGMSERLQRTMNEFADSLKTRWPLEDVLGGDIVAAAQRRIEEKLGLPTKPETLDAGLWIRADSFALIQAIVFLAARLQDHYDIRELRFRLQAEEHMAFIDLIWSGTTVSSETLYTWELEAMNVTGESSPLTLRDVIERHGGEIWYQREKAAHRAFFRFVLPVATQPAAAQESATPVTHGESRPEYYDFDLFTFSDSRIDLDRKLTDLVNAAVNTETTGLEPSAGDEIIQIGAVRALNGRLLRQEAIDQIIDPRIPLKPAGIPIHGITEDMVRGQPTIDVVLPVFHEFCADTVLVAHNAAFDMRFLQLKEARTGLKFDQPVLDTLLLSAVIHPNQESHKLEAIAARLGIDVIGRHTALGDAFVTGEVFLRMIPLLAEQGIHTLREALDAARQTYYARVKY